MAKFRMKGPDLVIKDVQKIYAESHRIFGGMTRAGAEVAMKQMAQGAQGAFKGGLASKVNPYLKLTKTYEKKDGAIATKAAYYGYLPTKKTKSGKPVMIRGYANPKGVPVPLLVALTEYGTRSTAMPAPFKAFWKGKHPFVRNAFNNSKPIKEAMLKAQKELSGGLLDE